MILAPLFFGIQRVSGNFALGTPGILTICFATLHHIHFIFNRFVMLDIVTESIAFIRNKYDSKLVCYDVLLVAKPNRLQFVASKNFDFTISLFKFNQLLRKIDCKYLIIEL